MICTSPLLYSCFTDSLGEAAIAEGDESICSMRNLTEHLESSLDRFTFKAHCNKSVSIGQWSWGRMRKQFWWHGSSRGWGSCSQLIFMGHQTYTTSSLLRLMTLWGIFFQSVKISSTATICHYVATLTGWAVLLVMSILKYICNLTQNLVKRAGGVNDLYYVNRSFCSGLEIKCTDTVVAAFLALQSYWWV